MAYFGSSQEEEDLEEEEEEEEVRNGGSVHLHGVGGSSQASASSSSCNSTPRKGKLPARQPLNGHGKNQTRAQSKVCLTYASFTDWTGCFQLVWRIRDPSKMRGWRGDKAEV